MLEGAGAEGWDVAALAEGVEEGKGEIAEPKIRSQDLGDRSELSTTYAFASTRHRGEAVSLTTRLYPILTSDLR